MKIGIVTGSISRKAGGLYFSVRALAREVDEKNEVTVYGLRDKLSAEDVAAWHPLTVKLHGVVGPAQLGFSPELALNLMKGKTEVMHTQGIWEATSWAVHRWHRKTGRPYLISPRGMLDPWAVQNSGFKKKVAAFLYEGRHLRAAGCLHALGQSELESIRRYGLKNPVCVIPNGVDLPENFDRTGDRELRKLLFLGRIHPKKGLRELLAGWKVWSGRAGWKLQIAGWDQGGHQLELERVIEESELGSEVEWLGSLYGAKKEEAFRAADAFILPSYSEGLPMAILEAWAYGLPVLMTDYCNLPEGFACGAAISIGTAPEEVQAGLEKLASMTAEDRAEMGRRGRALVAERFSWRKIAEEMERVYRWVLGGGDAPESVTR